MLNENDIEIILFNEFMDADLPKSTYIEESEIDEILEKKAYVEDRFDFLTIVECKYLYQYIKNERKYYNDDDLKNARRHKYIHVDDMVMHLSGKGKKLYAMLDNNKGNFYSNVKTSVNIDEVYDNILKECINSIDVYKMHFLYKVLSADDYTKILDKLEIMHIKKLNSKQIEKYISEALNTNDFCIVKTSPKGKYFVNALSGFKTLDYIDIDKLIECYKNGNVTVRNVVLLNWHKILSSEDLDKVLKGKEEPKIFVLHYGYKCEETFYNELVHVETFTQPVSLVEYA